MSAAGIVLGVIVFAVAVYAVVKLVAHADGIKGSRRMSGETAKQPAAWKRALRFVGVNTAAGIAQWLGPTVLALLICFLFHPFTVKIEVPGPEKKEYVLVSADAGPGEKVDYIPTMGWHPDSEVIADNLNPLWTQQFDQTPAGRAVLGDDDVFLWQAVRKVCNKGPPWYPNVNQLDVGCCVGCGWKHAADICQAVQILNGKRAAWKPIAVESIYGPSRVEIGGGQISGDGSIGAWAKEAAEKVGVLPMEQIGTHDLSTFSPARCREWGRRGMPDELEPTAKLHPVKGAALVKSWADVKKAISQGYPVAVCSNQGFRMERDETGRCRPQGTWAHCMAIIGVRSGPNEGAFILNSWGDKAHTGPVWPADAPVAGFWADAAVIDRMVRQGDSFALSDLQGFPERKKLPLDWFIRHDRRGQLDRVLTGIITPGGNTYWG